MIQSGYGHNRQQHNKRKYSRRTNSSSNEQHDSHTLRGEARHMYIHRQNRGRVLRYPHRRHQRQSKCLRIFSAQLCAHHHSGCFVSAAKNKVSNDCYLVTDLRIGEASNPGPQPRNQRLYIASAKAGEKRAPGNDADNFTDKDGHLKISTYNGNCFNTAIKWINESDAKIHAIQEPSKRGKILEIHK